MRETPAPNVGTLRPSYPRHVAIPTRWADNDVYGHVNNVVYYAFFDTAVNGLLVEAGVLDIARSPVIGLVVETGCRYHAPLAFPDLVTAGVRVARIGRSSVRYEIGLFRGDAVEAAADGFFVHVYVDRVTPPAGCVARAVAERSGRLDGRDGILSAVTPQPPLAMARG